jgi:DNA-binding CsgD family transcriptional regulator
MGGGDSIEGREDELSRIANFLDGVTDGAATLLIDGEAGIGKTTLWRATLDLAAERGFQTISCRAAEADTRISYAGLADLLTPAVADVRERLPAPQRRSIEVALLLGDPVGSAPDRRAVSVATLAVLSSLAARGPLIVAVDDVQWLDAPTARVLGFVARRLRDEQIGIVATLRLGADLADPIGLASLPETKTYRLTVGPLAPEALSRLLRRQLADLARSTLLRIADQSGGNPLLALEVARSVSFADLRVGEPLPVPERIESLLRARVAAVPDETTEILLLAASMARPRVSIVRAASRRGVRLERALARAEESEILTLEGEDIRFTHPLLASTVYANASPARRRDAHRRLAAAAEDPEERARHLALATLGSDAGVAAALDDAARSALVRGAPDEAASLADLARRLTPSGESDALRERVMSAAEYRFQSGDIRRARELAEEAISLAARGRARALTLFRWCDMEWDDVRRCRELLTMALEEAEDDPLVLARLYDGLSWVELLSGNIERGLALSERSVRLAESSGLPAPGLIGIAWARSILGRPSKDDWTRAWSLEGRLTGMDAYTTPGLFHGQSLIWAGELDRAREELAAADRACVERGQEGMRWDILAWLATLECRVGNLHAAAAHAREAHEIVMEAGQEKVLHVVLAAKALVEALRGEAEAARADGTEGLRLAQRHGDVFWEMHNRGALGILDLSLGDAESAHEHLLPLPGYLERAGIGEPGAFPYLGDDAEALVALGRIDHAEALLAWLEERGRILDRPLALATAARCRGLIAAAQGDEREAASAFELSLGHHSRIAQPLDLARTLLALGRFQRRVKRRGAARETLRSARAIFDEVGAALWSSMADAELARIGGRAASPSQLAPTERRIVELVAEGRTNREVADALFVSVKTVEANLSRAYHKLGIRSRRELRSRLVDAERRREQT